MLDKEKRTHGRIGVGRLDALEAKLGAGQGLEPVGGDARPCRTRRDGEVSAERLELAELRGLRVVEDDIGERVALEPPNMVG